MQNRLVFYIFVLGCLFGILAHFTVGLSRDIFSDDAYYYTIIAVNYAENGIMTFDGISRTNGFHPLFMFLQVIVVFIAGTEPIILYRAINILCSLLLFAGVLSAGFGRDRYKYMAVVCICLFRYNIHYFYNGMESSLTFLLFLIIIIFLERGNYTGAGIFGMLLVSARLDTLIYILFFLFGSIMVFKRKIIWQLFIPIIFVFFYLLYNFWHFEHFMPISGVLRSSFPLFNIQLHNLFRGWVPVGVLIMAVFAIAVKRKNALIMGLALGGIAQILSIVLFQKWGKIVSLWYLGLPLMTGLLCVFFIMEKKRYFKKICMVFIVLFMVYNGALFFRRIYNFRGSEIDLRENTQIIEFIKKSSKDSLWAYTDCGALSFWGERSFVNLDGLVNDFEYQEYLKRGELGLYLREREVDYIIGRIWNRWGSHKEKMFQYRIAPHVFSGEYDYFEFYVYSYMYDRYSDIVVLDREIRRSDEFQDGKAEAVFVVFEL